MFFVPYSLCPTNHCFGFFDVTGFSQISCVLFSYCCTNYHKCSGLRHHRFLNLQFWSQSPKIRVSAGLLPHGESASLPFLASRGCPQALAHALLPSSKTAVQHLQILLHLTSESLITSSFLLLTLMIILRPLGKSRIISPSQGL